MTETTKQERTRGLFVKAERRRFVLIISGICAFWLLSSLLLFGVCLLQGQREKKLQNTQQNVTVEQSATVAVQLIRNRMAQIETGAASMQDALRRWESSRPACTTKLTEREESWISSGSSSSGDIVVFSPGSTKETLLSTLGGDQFNDHARTIFNSIPDLESIGVIGYSGVLRRFPGGQPIVHHENRRELLSTPVVQQAARSREEAPVWFAGNSLGLNAPEFPVSLALNVIAEGSHSAVVFLEANGVDFLPRLFDGAGHWSLIVDQRGNTVVADSLARLLLGTHERLEKHQDAELSALGKRVLRLRNGNGRFVPAGSPTQIAFQAIPGTGWTYIHGIPIATLSADFSKTTFFGILLIVLAELLLITVTIAVIILVRKNSRKNVRKWRRFETEFDAAVGEIGKPLPQSPELTETTVSGAYILENVYQRARGVAVQMQDLRIQLDHNTQLLRTLPVGLTTIDLRQKVMFANVMAERFHGLHLEGRTAGWLQADGEWFEQDLHKRVVTNRESMVVMRTARLNDMEQTLMVTYIPYLGAQGRVEGMTEVLVELGEAFAVKTQEDTAASSESTIPQDFINEFIAVISSEMLVPINSLGAQMKMLKRALKAVEPTLANRLDEINHSFVQASNLMESVFLYGRIKSKRTNSNLRTVAIHDILESLKEELLCAASFVQHEISVAIPDEEMIIRNDPTFLKHGLLMVANYFLHVKKLHELEFTLQRQRNGVFVNIRCESTVFDRETQNELNTLKTGNFEEEIHLSKKLGFGWVTMFYVLDLIGGRFLAEDEQTASFFFPSFEKDESE